MDKKNFKTGDIIAFKTKGFWYNPLTWISWFIRKIAKIEYNHVGVVVKIHNVLFIYEAVDKGFLPKKLSDKLKEKRIKDYIILRTEFIPKDFSKKATKLLGTSYDFKGLLWNQLILNITGEWIGRKTNQQDKLYCYEAVFYLYKEIFPEWWKEHPKNLFKNKNFNII